MILAFCGKKGAGKDTVANLFYNFLHTQIGCDDYYVWPDSFAAPIKQAACILFNWPENIFSFDHKEVKDPNLGISPREAAQLLGTEFAQFFLPEKLPEFKEKVGRQLWVKILEKKYNKQCSDLKNHAITQNKKPLLLVTDLRFPHEIDFIKKNQGIIIKVENNRLESNEYSAHESEKYEMPADYVIHNNGSLKELQKIVYGLAKEIL